MQSVVVWQFNAKNTSIAASGDYLQLSSKILAPINAQFLRNILCYTSSLEIAVPLQLVWFPCSMASQNRVPRDLLDSAHPTLPAKPAGCPTSSHRIRLVPPPPTPSGEKDTRHGPRLAGRISWSIAMVNVPDCSVDSPLRTPGTSSTRNRKGLANLVVIPRVNHSDDRNGPFELAKPNP